MVYYLSFPQIAEKNNSKFSSAGINFLFEFENILNSTIINSLLTIESSDSDTEALTNYLIETEIYYMDGLSHINNLQNQNQNYHSHVPGVISISGSLNNPKTWEKVPQAFDVIIHNFRNDFLLNIELLQIGFGHLKNNGLWIINYYPHEVISDQSKSNDRYVFLNWLMLNLVTQEKYQTNPIFKSLKFFSSMIVIEKL
jgi:hypothetical protein